KQSPPRRTGLESHFFGQRISTVVDTPMPALYRARIYLQKRSQRLVAAKKSQPNVPLSQQVNCG
ncbi:MAG TPA: hypothetical protein V6D33_14040, partial [Cyanophyceae cyanobacterium]